MTSKFEKTQGIKVRISNAPATEANPLDAIYIEASCATKEISFTGGQKTDIDTTVLCSEEQEMENGLPAPAEMTISRNWAGAEDAQDALDTANENNGKRAIQVIFPSGHGYSYLAEVRQSSWSAATNSVVGASYTLRIKGKPVRIRPVAP